MLEYKSLELPQSVNEEAEVGGGGGGGKTKIAFYLLCTTKDRSLGSS